MKLLKSLQAAHDVMINNGEPSVKYFLCNASNMHVVGTSGCPGQCHFRQKESDKNHTGLSPLRICEICSFVFTSDQVCPGGSMIIGLMIGTYFSHGFGTHSCIFGCITCRYCYMIDTNNCRLL